MAEIEVHQLPALSQHFFKHSLPPQLRNTAEIMIAAEIKVSQRWALHQHFCKTL